MKEWRSLRRSVWILRGNYCGQIERRHVNGNFSKLLQDFRHLAQPIAADDMKVMVKGIQKGDDLEIELTRKVAMIDQVTGFDIWFVRFIQHSVNSHWKRSVNTAQNQAWASSSQRLVRSIRVQWNGPFSAVGLAFLETTKLTEQIRIRSRGRGGKVENCRSSGLKWGCDKRNVGHVSTVDEWCAHVRGATASAGWLWTGANGAE